MLGENYRRKKRLEKAYRDLYGIREVLIWGGGFAGGGLGSHQIKIRCLQAAQEALSGCQKHLLHPGGRWENGKPGGSLAGTIGRGRNQGDSGSKPGLGGERMKLEVKPF